LIIGSPSQGIRTRRKQYKPNYVGENATNQASCVENFSFVSTIEPTFIGDALEDH
jgi:hypothetical protein